MALDAAREDALGRVGAALEESGLHAEMVRELGVAISEMVLRLPSAAPDDAEGLSEAEMAALRSVGVDPSAPEQQELARRAVARATAEYARFTSTALPTAEAAGRAGVSASRMRALAADGQLLGVKVRGDLRFPAFQFEEAGLVREITRVVPALDLEQLHPMAVERWFLIDRDELDGLCVRDWLRTGRPLEPVLAMAGRAALLP